MARRHGTSRSGWCFGPVEDPEMHAKCMIPDRCTCSCHLGEPQPWRDTAADEIDPEDDA